MKTVASQRVDIASGLHKHLYPYLYALILTINIVNVYFSKIIN